MKIKNLDTGEEVELEEAEAGLNGFSAHTHAGTSASTSGATLNTYEDAPKQKNWFKNVTRRAKDARETAKEKLLPLKEKLGDKLRTFQENVEKKRQESQRKKDLVGLKEPEELSEEDTLEGGSLPESEQHRLSHDSPTKTTLQPLHPRQSPANTSFASRPSTSGPSPRLSGPPPADSLCVQEEPGEATLSLANALLLQPADDQAEPEDLPLLKDTTAGVAGTSSQVAPLPPAGKPVLGLPAKVYSTRKAAQRQLVQVRAIQALSAHTGVVWVARFSRDSRLLATGGQDHTVRLWAVAHYGRGVDDKLISAYKPASTQQHTSLSTTVAHPLPTTSTLPTSSAPASYTTAGAAAPSAPEPSAPSTTDSTLDATLSELDGSFSAAAGAAGTSSSSAPSASAAVGSAALTPPPLAPSSRPPLLTDYRVSHLHGHKEDVIDLSWSRCKLLLTASLDCTVKLWNTDDGECLRTFTHPDWATAVQFHPHDPKRFVSACADSKVRIWSIPDGAVLCYASAQHEVLTALCFSPCATRVVAGTQRGRVRFYEYSSSGGDNKLEYVAQLDAKNVHGSGKRVSSIVPVPNTSDKYIVATCDSRIRLVVGYAPVVKYKGYKSSNMRVPATLSSSCSHIIAGSDDGWVYMWESGLRPQHATQAPNTASSSNTAVATTTTSSSGGPAASRTGLGNVGGRGSGGVAGAPGGTASSSPGHVAQQQRDDGLDEEDGSVGLKAKNGLYEAFLSPEASITVALLAPDSCRQGRDAASYLGSGASTAASTGPASFTFSPMTQHLQRVQAEQQHVGAGTTAPAALPAVPAWVSSSVAACNNPLMGALFVVAGFSGMLYVYENLPATSLV